MCATEDGRRLYVFGGFDGSQLLNDVYYCEAERGIWSPVTVGGQAPEPREGHTAAIIGKYLLVGGTCVMTGAGVSAVGLWGAFGGGVGDCAWLLWASGGGEFWLGPFCLGTIICECIPAGGPYPAMVVLWWFVLGLGNCCSILVGLWALALGSGTRPVVLTCDQ